ncbi:MAG TPA: glycoside hydrolase family 19 protein [Chroococcidiopsis sp.]
MARLEQLLLTQPPAPHDADYFIDRSIRKLTGLPPTPAGAPPYQGIYSSSFTMEQYRNGATSRLLELMLQKLSALDPIDDDVDKFIRLLSDLPEKPAGSEPYTRLFILREDTPDPPTVDANVTIVSKKQFLTLDQTLQIVGSTQLKDRITAIMPGLNATLEKFEINTPLRISHFLGQILHESGGFRYLREIWGPTDAQRRYEPPSKLASTLGNAQAGDGKRYMGRGVIQLTGRSNYAQFSKAMGVDFVASPELVESPQYAVMVGGWYWTTRKINAPADKDDLLRVTRLVNGGTNGLADREKYLKRAKQVLGI